VLLQEHWLPVHVGEGCDDEEWPPGHLSVSPDAPAPDDVGRREAVCQAVQLNVVAVLSVVRGGVTSCRCRPSRVRAVFCR
jgi:hypothetical protein